MPVRVLELFSGTHSVAKVCTELGWDTVSVDIDGKATFNEDILTWDYKQFAPHHFDIIWASPPCHTFSVLRRSWIGKKLKFFGDNIVTKEMLDADMIKRGLPLVRKTEEIIEYLKPKWYFIENPAFGKMRYYIDRPNYVVDYCRYSDWGYRKPTRIWTNVTNFNPKQCQRIGSHTVKIGKVCERRVNSLNSLYRIPPDLIVDLFKSTDALPEP